MIDSHFHMHHNFMIQKYSNTIISNMFEELIPTLEKYNVEKLNAIFLPYNVGLVNQIKEFYKGINSGIYLFLRDNPSEMIEKSKTDFDFIKIQKRTEDSFNSEKYLI